MDGHLLVQLGGHPVLHVAVQRGAGVEVQRGAHRAVFHSRSINNGWAYAHPWGLGSTTALWSAQTSAMAEGVGEDGCSWARKGSPVVGLGLPWANRAVHGWLMARGRGGTVGFAGSALILVE